MTVQLSQNRPDGKTGKSMRKNTIVDKDVCSSYGDELARPALRVCQFVTIMHIRSQGRLIMAPMFSTLSFKTFFLLSAVAISTTALAQQRPSDAPPQLQRIEPGSDTPITITPKSGNNNKITQTKDGGRVTEVQVSSGGSHYTMKGVRPGSVQELGDQTGSTVRPPQWKVMEFDLSRKKKTDPEGAGATDGTVNAPPPQTVK